LNPGTASEQVGKGVCIPGNVNYNASQCFIPVGGSTLWELSNEIRYQILGPFSLANFCDMGDVSPNQSDIRLRYLHLSCGGGARYDTPIGPIRFDVGYRVQPAQVLGFASEAAAAKANPVNGTPPTIFGQPLAFSIGVGESF
jgi:outer membrane protein insertion porin family/translocation and assembly module TamA